MAKRQNMQITTPVGIAVYPKLNEPDTKFKAEGEYTTKLQLENTPETKALIAKLEQAKADAVNMLSSEAGKKLKAAPHFPIVENEDGTFLLKAGLKAKVETKSGRSWDQRPGLFDSKGKPIQGDSKIGSGSKLKLACEVVPYNNPAMGGASITLRLQAVQVIDLVEYGKKDAASFGFGEEEGYVEEFTEFPEEQAETTTATAGPKKGGASF